MDQILDRLWLGSWDDGALHHQLGPARCCTYLLNLSERPYASTLPLAHLPLADEIYHPPEVWSRLVHWLAAFLTTRHTVLVHCRLGVSRAPSLVAAYLAWCGHRRDPEHALVWVLARRGCVKPHAETWRGIMTWWSSL